MDVGRRDLMLMGAGAVVAGAAGPAAAETGELLKSISFIRRRPDISREQFNAVWLGRHGPGARSIPGIAGFVLGEVINDAARGASRATDAPVLDGIAESWQAPGIDRAAQAREHPHVREWLGLAPSYIGAITILSTREHVMVPPVRGGTKVMTLIFRKAEQTREEFVRHMLDVHGPLSREVPGLRGYVLSEIVRRPAMAGLPAIEGLGEIDMIGQSWMSPDPSERTPDSPQRKAWLEDGARNFGRFYRYAMREHEFVPPPYGTAGRKGT